MDVKAAMAAPTRLGPYTYMSLIASPYIPQKQPLATPTIVSAGSMELESLLATTLAMVLSGAQ